MKKLRIIVDLDSIVVDFMEGLWDSIEAEHGIRGTTDTVTDFYGLHKGLPDDFKGDTNSHFHRPGFFEGLQPLAGAIEGLKRLTAAGHEIVIASSHCTPHSAAEKILWCKEQLPFVDQKKIFIGHSKYMISGDVLIDDHIANAKAFREAQPNALILTIAYPYNKDDGDVYHQRVDGHRDPGKAWEEIVELIASRASDDGG